MAEENENPGKQIRSALLDNLSRALQTKMKVARLQVDVVAGQGLCPKDATGYSDPYCVCSLVDSTGRIMEQNRTKTLHRTLEPRWLESFSVWRQLPSARDDWILRIECWNWNRFLPDNFMGRIEFILAGLDNLYQAHRSNFAGACELAPREKKNDKVSGTIKVRIQYMSENSRLVNSRQKAISEASDEFAKAKQPELNRLITDWEDLDVGLRDTLPRFKGFHFNEVDDGELVELERGVHFYENGPYEPEHAAAAGRGSGAAAAAAASDDDAGFGPNPAGYNHETRPRFASEVDYDRTDLALARAGLPVPDRPAGASRPVAPTERPRASSARPRLDEFFKRQNSMPQLWGDSVSSRSSLDSRYVPSPHASRRGGPPPSTSDSELSSKFNEYASSDFSEGTSLSMDPRHAPIPPPAPASAGHNSRGGPPAPPAGGAPHSPPNAQHFDYAAQHRHHDQDRHRHHHSPHRHSHPNSRPHEEHSSPSGRHAGALGSHRPHRGGGGHHGRHGHKHSHSPHRPSHSGLDPHGLGSGDHHHGHHAHAHEHDHSRRDRAQSHALARREQYGHDDGRHRHHDDSQQHVRARNQLHAAGFDPRTGSPLPPPPATPPPPTQTPPPPPPSSRPHNDRRATHHADVRRPHSGQHGAAGAPPPPPAEPHPIDVRQQKHQPQQEIPSGYLGSFDSGRNQDIPPPAPSASPPPAPPQQHQHYQQYNWQRREEPSHSHQNQHRQRQHHQQQQQQQPPLPTFAPDSGGQPQWLVEQERSHERPHHQSPPPFDQAPPRLQHNQPRGSPPPAFDDPSGPPPPPPPFGPTQPQPIADRSHY